MKSIRQNFQVSYSVPIVFTRAAFQPDNLELCKLLTDAGDKRWRVLVIVDADVVAANSNLLQEIENYGRQHTERLEFVTSPLVLSGGEACKNSHKTIDDIHVVIEKHGICRHSFVLVIGGGALLDAAGFAVATAHRGIRLIRMPTTTLAQDDAGIGVKNGINAFGRKNFLGSFAPPFAVINDYDFLATLSHRDLIAGMSEAVKVAVIKDRKFFDFLYTERLQLAAGNAVQLEKLIFRCAELHSEHIATQGDPFENGSARPLDFGHWCAHKLEDITEGKIRHGEAVAIGIALDSLYAQEVGLLSELDINRILVTLEGIGFATYHWSLGWLDMAQALGEFREHLGGELTITLPKGIGDRVDVHQIDTALMAKCAASLKVRQQKKGGNDEYRAETLAVRGDFIGQLS